MFVMNVMKDSSVPQKVPAAGRYHTFKLAIMWQAMLAVLVPMHTLKCNFTLSIIQITACIASPSAAIAVVAAASIKLSSSHLASRRAGVICLSLGEVTCIGRSSAKERRQQHQQCQCPSAARRHNLHCSSTSGRNKSTYLGQGWCVWAG
jgi:hypothetical protein